MNLDQNKDETKQEYISRIIEKAETHIAQLDKYFKEIKGKGLKFCKNCGCTIYPDKEHSCD